MCSFLKYLQEHKDYRIYHWHNYERKHMALMMEKHKIRKALAEKVMVSMIDLYKVFKASYVFPTYGRSIKDIARFVGFDWRQEAVDARESMALYQAYTRDPKKNRKALKQLLDYNEDDCRAMVAVMDWVNRQ